MKTLTFTDREQWLAARRGKITGSRLKDIVTLRGTEKKIGFYELVAERLGIPADEESPMDRGHRLEEEAIAVFEENTGKNVNKDLVIWARDENESIAISPDGFIGKTEAVEVKCLSSARHIEAVLTNSVPKDYRFQVLQYFIVNDKLKKLYFVFYDPRIPVKPYHCIEISRKDVADDVEKFLEYERQTMAEIDEIVLKLTDF